MKDARAILWQIIGSFGNQPACWALPQLLYMCPLLFWWCYMHFELLYRYHATLLQQHNLKPVVQNPGVQKRLLLNNA